MQFDEEHELWGVEFVNAQGAHHALDWGLCSSAEYRQMMSKHRHISVYMQPPFVVETLARGAKESADEEAGEAENRGSSQSRGQEPKGAPPGA